MKSRLNITKNGKKLKTGYWLGGIFAVSTIFCSFGTGSLPQINSISNVLFTTFGINQMLTGAILAILLGLVIIGGIRRIAKVTASLVPTMAIIYFLGAIAVLITNYQNILPAIASIFTDVFSGSAAAGGFLGASIKFAMQKGVNRGLFSNEAGQGSAPIAHAAARAHEPVSEGMVAILEPFIDTIIICSLTGLTILSSGVWKEKHENRFQPVDTIVIEGSYTDVNTSDRNRLFQFMKDPQNTDVQTFTGFIEVSGGAITNSNITVLNSRSIAENVLVNNSDGTLFTGRLPCKMGNIEFQNEGVYLAGKSLLHSAPLTAKAFTRGLFGDFGQYLVSIGLLLFAFSTAISWSYYGDRAVTYLWSAKYVIVFRIIYVIGFFIASFADTTVVWTFSGITIALMAFPNLIGLLLLHKEIKTTITEYWRDFREEFNPVKKQT
jgi:AGCS family alanine or glycine:cation symporter